MRLVWGVTKTIIYEEVNMSKQSWKKRVLSLCLTLAMVVGVLASAQVGKTVAYAAGSDNSEYVKYEGLNWTIDRKAGAIVRFPWDWEGGEVPAEIDGMKVKTIGEYSCQYRNTNIKEIIIPEGVTKVDEGAFRGNPRLTKMTVASSVKTIGDYAFQNCDCLEFIDYKGNQKKIKFGNFAFRGCYFLHPDFSKAYKKGIYYKKLHEVKLTGDFAKDMIAIGRSQLGYHQGNDGSQMHGYNKLGGEYYAEYNYFSGLPDWQWGMKDYVKEEDYKWGYGGWCGNFCDWCISMAGVPSECLAYTGKLDELKWKDTVYAGGSYKIKAGDVLHFSAGHYCMVVSVKVDGKKVKIDTLNGNPVVEKKIYVLNKKDGSNDESHNYDLAEILPMDVSKVKGVNTYKVTFDADGGKTSVTEKKVYEGAFYGLMPKPTRSGYTFDGWYTEKNGGGTKITSYRNVYPKGDITVYANWKKGDEPKYLDINSYVSQAPEHSSIMDKFAGIYLTKSWFSYKDVKKKAQKTQIKRRNGKGKMTFQNVTKGSKKKYIKISKKGVVTIKKGAPKGTYGIYVVVEKYKTVNMTQATVYITIGDSKSATRKPREKVKYYKIDGYYVGFENSTGRLTWVDKHIGRVPKKVNGKTVKIIGEWCFSGNLKMKTAKIPSTVKKLEKGAFYGCKALKKVVFPKGFKVGNVEDKRLFWACNKLETVVNNPDKEWKARIKTFKDTLKYLKKQDPQYYVENVRDFKNQWVPDKEDDRHRDYTDEEWTVVEKKAKALTKGCKTDMAKAKKISKWIVSYLHYDEVWMKKFKEWRETHDPDKEKFPLKKYTDAYNLIMWEPSEHEGETAMTTCGGYGNLTQALFCAAGIPCVHIHREQNKELGETIDHVFNVAYVDGKWIWLDNTYSDKTLDYFNCGIAGFAASDHRCDRLNLEYLTDLVK